MSKLIEIYLGSVELKKLLISRSKELNIPFSLVCKSIGIDYNKFLNKYVNVSDSRGFDVSESQFEELLNSFGISVRHQFVIDDNFDAVKKIDELNSLS